MTRTRVLRFLLLALLVPFVVFVAMTFRTPPKPPQPDGSRPHGTEATQMEIYRAEDGRPLYRGKVRHAETLEGGDFRFEGIEEFEIYREDRLPLIVAADKAHVTKNEQGKLQIKLEGGVRLEDREEDLVLSFPALEVDRGADEARSLGQVELGGRNYHGTAGRIVYHLGDGPSTISAPHLIWDDGSTLDAERARLIDGMDDVEFEGSVIATQNGRELNGDHVRIQRDAEGRIQHVVATMATVEQASTPTAPISSLRGDRLELGWGEDEEPNSVQLEGNALLRQGPNSLIAERIDARRGERPGWEFDAVGNVLATTLTETGPAVLTAAELSGRSNLEGAIEQGEARGEVRFQSQDVKASGHRAKFGGGLKERVELYAGPDERARMARDRSRVAADTIVTDRNGSEFVATGRVEASLLPQDSTEATADGLFQGDEAVHFVSTRMEGDVMNNVIVFTGAVRGWQSERTLSAQRVEIDQQTDGLRAFEQVLTRLPKREERAASKDDFIEITADALDYRGQQHQAHYTGNARARETDGWLEADELQVDLHPTEGGIDELRGVGHVRFEFRNTEAGEASAPSTGTADRMTYRPDDARAVLYGDQTPAVVRRTGVNGDSASGRVITYYLDTGSWAVEGGGEINSSRAP